VCAAQAGQLAVVHYLLDSANADPTIMMKDASTAFDWAVLSGDILTMEYVATHPRVDIAAMNRHGCAAVQWAASAGNIASCRWLMAKGLDLGHVNKNNHGAVKKASWKDHRPLLEWLLLAADGRDNLLLLLQPLLMLHNRALASSGRLAPVYWPRHPDLKLLLLCCRARTRLAAAVDGHDRPEPAGVDDDRRARRVGTVAAAADRHVGGQKRPACAGAARRAEGLRRLK
jgi:hypothetical protein